MYSYPEDSYLKDKIDQQEQDIMGHIANKNPFTCGLGFCSRHKSSTYTNYTREDLRDRRGTRGRNNLTRQEKEKEEEERKSVIWPHSLSTLAARLEKTETV